MPSATTPTISLNKTYTTRKGQPVKLYAIYTGQAMAIHGAILCDGKWQAAAWRDDGIMSPWREDGILSQLGMLSDHDLIESKPRIKATRYINIMRHESGDIMVCGYKSDELADAHASRQMRFGHSVRVAKYTLNLDIEEGHGLDTHIGSASTDRPMTG